MSPRTHRDGSKLRTPLPVRLALWVAARRLPRGGDLDPGMRREILEVLRQRLVDAHEQKSLPTFAVRAGRECIAMSALTPSTSGTGLGAGLGGGLGWADDLTLATKGLLRRPAFAVTAVAILALGIGAGTAAFSVLDSVLYRAPHYDQDRTLAVIWKELHGGAFRISGHGAEEIELYRQAESFSAVAATTTDTVSVFDGERATRMNSRAADPELLPMLGVEPILGRAFAEDDLDADRVLISEAMWMERFGRDPQVLGELLEIDGIRREIIGVLPASVALLSLHHEVDLWLPLEPQVDSSRFRVSALVRLRPDVEVSEAEAELESLMAANLERSADDPPMKTLVRRHQDDRLPGDTASKLWMIVGGVGLLLLTSCANASSLALTRDADRAHELRTRLALGASPGRVVRLLALEGLLLGGAAAALGGLASWQAVPLLVRFAPSQVRSLVAAGSHGAARTLIFVMLVSLCTAALVALLPILRFRLRGRARRRVVGDGRSTRRWGTALVTGQVATAFVLLVASGLLLRSFERMMRIDPGYALDRVQLTVQLPPGVEDEEAIRLFHDRVKEQVQSLPGLQHASWVDVPTRPPIFGGVEFAVDGEARPVGEPRALMPAFTGDPDMFATLGIDLVAGRGFQPDDPGEVIVLGQSLVQALFGEDDPIGHSLDLSPEIGPYTIIGVAADVKAAGPEEPLGPWEVYRPIRPRGTGTLVVGFDRDPLSRLAELRAAVAAVDPRAPVDDVATLAESWNTQMERPRFLVEMVVALAALTLALTLFGLYSVLSYAVAQRRREIGLRMALGADARRVRWLVVRQSVVAVLSGLALGGLVSWVFRRGLEAQLFETSITDVWSAAGAMAVLLTAALVASWLPATRATRIEPSRSLREES